MRFSLTATCLLLTISVPWSQPDSTVIQGNNTVGPFCISRYWLDSASLVVTQGTDTLKPKVQYRYLDRENTVFFEQPLPDSVVTIVRFRRMGRHLPKIFFHRDPAQLQRIDQFEGDSALPVDSPVAPRTVEEGQSLRIGGSKSFGVSASSGGGMSLNQSLQVQIQGNVSKNTSVRASLSDQDLPLQPEGTTRTLSEIEQARIDIEGEYASATLGDFHDTEDLKFIRFSKKIQGVRGALHTDRAKVRLAGATSKGTFRSFSFEGQEGRQGPYRLVGQGNQTNLVVLAGTETVWLNGRRLVRGHNYDYVIDYAYGSITFTLRHLIHSESEITVDYEYLEQEFERSLIHGSASISRGPAQIRFTGIQEHDSRERPLNFWMTQQDQDALRIAGDNPDLARTGSLHLLSTTEAGVNGFYIRVDSAGLLFYRHKPPDSLEVYQGETLYGSNFYPAQSGDYERVDLAQAQELRSVYAYVGSGQGNYLPGGTLPMPRTNRVADLSAIGRLGKFDLAGEIAGSQYDQNTFSGKDDGDNVGFAHNASVGFGLQQRQGFYARANSGGNNVRFRAFGTAVDDYSYRKRWNLGNQSFAGQQERLQGELMGGWAWNRHARIQIETGVLRQDSGRTDRAAGEIHLGRSGLGQLQIGDEEVRVAVGGQNTSLHRDRSRLALDAKWLGPYLGLGHEWEGIENGNTVSAQGWQSITLGLEPGLLKLWTPSAGAEWRRDQTAQTAQLLSGKDSLHTIQASTRLDMRPWHGLSFRSSLQQRRRTHLRQPLQPTIVYDLAELSTTYEPESDAVVLRSRYNLSSSELQSRFDKYQFVGEGRGTHMLDSVTGDYRPFEGGGYDYYGQATDSAATGRQIQLQSWLRLRPAQWKKTGGFLDDVSTTTSLQLETQRLQRVSGARLRYAPSAGINAIDSQTTLTQRTSLTQDLVFQPRASGTKVKLRYRPSQYQSYRYGYETQSTILYRAEAEKLLTKAITVEAKTQQETIERSRASSSYSALDYSILNREAAPGLRFRFLSHYTIGTAGGVGNSVEHNSTAEYDYYFVTPFAIRNFARQGRLRADYAWYSVSGKGVLYYQMARGFAVGVTHRWSLAGDYRASDNLIFTLHYSGRLEQDAERPFQQANVELRAFF